MSRKLALAGKPLFSVFFICLLFASIFTPTSSAQAAWAQLHNTTGNSPLQVDTSTGAIRINCNALTSQANQGSYSLCYNYTKNIIYGSVQNNNNLQFTNVAEGSYLAYTSGYKTATKTGVKYLVTFPSANNEVSANKATLTDATLSGVTDKSGKSTTDWSTKNITLYSDGGNYLGTTEVATATSTNTSKEATATVAPSGSSSSVSSSGPSTTEDACGGIVTQLGSLALLGMGNPTGVISQALCSSMSYLSDFAQTTIATLGGFIDGLLNTPAKMMNATSGTLVNTWTSIRDATLLLLTLALLIIAFANILNIDEKLGYGLNLMIPKIIISIIASFFSFIVARIFLDLAGALQILVTNLSTAQGLVQNPTKPALDLMNGVSNSQNSMALALFLVIILIFLLLVTLWLVLLLTVRIAVIWILVALSPLAMLMNIMPFSQQFFKQWWEQWWKWLFMGPAISLMLYFASALIAAFHSSFNSGTGLDTYMYLIMAAVAIFMAGTIPLTMGKEVFGAISNAGKKALGYAKTGDKYLNKGRVTSALGLRRTNIESRHKAESGRANALRATQGSRWGRFAAGVDEKQARALRQTIVSEQEKELMARSEAEIMSLANGTGIEAEAAQNIMAKSGRADATNPQVVQRAQDDKAFADIIGDKQKDFNASAALSILAAHPAGWAPTPNSTEAKVIEKANKSLEGKIEDFGKDTYEYMEKFRPDVLQATASSEATLRKVADLGKPKIMASFGHAIEEHNANPANAGNQIINGFAPGTDGFTAFNSMAAEAQNWRNTHGGGNVY